eukprot:Anaeramoba_flamelloidesa348360_12.p1 GENE.a348360_12~~a348360_12.p1  ORF type:complete len:101 (-),score=2.97 a348360_12:11-313(-)
MFVIKPTHFRKRVLSIGICFRYTYKKSFCASGKENGSSSLNVLYKCCPNLSWSSKKYKRVGNVREIKVLLNSLIFGFSISFFFFFFKFFFLPKHQFLLVF